MSVNKKRTHYRTCPSKEFVLSQREEQKIPSARNRNYKPDLTMSPEKSEDDLYKHFDALDEPTKAAVSEDESESVSEPKQKRGRGRPKKNPDTVVCPVCKTSYNDKSKYSKRIHRKANS